MCHFIILCSVTVNGKYSIKCFSLPPQTPIRKKTPYSQLKKISIDLHNTSLTLLFTYTNIIYRNILDSKSNLNALSEDGKMWGRRSHYAHAEIPFHKNIIVWESVSHFDICTGMAMIEWTLVGSNLSRVQHNSVGFLTCFSRQHRRLTSYLATLPKTQ